MRGWVRFGGTVWSLPFGALDISVPDIWAPGLSGVRTFFLDSFFCSYVVSVLLEVLLEALFEALLSRCRSCGGIISVVIIRYSSNP